MCNPKVDELSMMTYLSRFPHAKPKAGAPVQVKTNVARVRAYGPGLRCVHSYTLLLIIGIIIDTRRAYFPNSNL